MLETSINELNLSIKTLIDMLNDWTLQPITNQVAKEATPIRKAAVKVIQEVLAESKQPESVTISELRAPVNNPDELREELQALSSSMIANKRATKDQIKAVIATYNGALILKNVPDVDLPELKAKILALGA